MFKRANKITALLVAAASVLSIVPAMAADSTRLGTKDGTIEKAVAFDGKYIYEGYKGDSDKAVYFNDGEKDKELTDYEDYDFTTAAYDEKYTIAEDGNTVDDEYLVDLTNGDITEDTVGDKLDSAASKLEKAIKKTDKYDGVSVSATQLNTLRSSAAFQEPWYSFGQHSVKDRNGVLKDTTIFTDGNGEYIDSSVLANIYAYSSTKGKIVKVEKFDKAYTDIGLTVDLIKQPEVIAQDKDYLYAIINVDITDGNGTAGTSQQYEITTGAAVTIGSTTSAENDADKLYSWIKSNLSGYTVTYDSATDKITAVAKVGGVVTTAPITGTNVLPTVTGTAGTNGTTVTNAWYLQKISKAQGDTDEEAYEPKSVASYQIDNKSLYDDGDANDAYEWLIASDGVANFRHVQVKDGSLYVYEYDDLDTVKVFKLNLKQVKKDPMSSIYGTTKLDGYLVEKDGDSDQDFENTTGNALSVDVNGVLWALHDGKIVKFDGKDKTTVYTCDSGLDQLDVYDDKNLIAWSYDDERYTTATEGTSVTKGEAVVVAPVAPVIGWVKGTDGTTWTFNDYTGAKVTSKWVNYQGSWYYLKADGIMATGWYNDQGTWYYLNASGAMATGWFKDVDGNWYYLAASGAMLANTTVDGYRLGASGAWVR